jgi:phytoene synthase
VTATLPVPAASPLAPPPAPPPPGAARRAQDDYLRQAFRYHSRTFSLATRLLPAPERLPVATLYLYCRTVDTLADCRVLEIGVEQACAEADRLRAELDATLAGRPPAESPDAFLWSRLAEVHAQYGLEAAPMHELLDGACWDLHARSIESLDDLMAYANLVAGSVGAMMLPFLVRARADIARLDAPARALGNAMQLTNILRDVGEDWRDLDRTYLPLDALRAARIDLATVAPGGPDWPAYVALVEQVMTRAEALYDEAERGITDLRPAAQLGIRSAARMYRGILNGVRANGYDNLTRRAVVPLPRKLRLLVDGSAYRTRRARLLARHA